MKMKDNACVWFIGFMCTKSYDNHVEAIFMYV